MTVDEFAGQLDQNLDALCGEIRSGSYRPLPVVRIRPSFLGSSDRALVIPAVRDRVVQRAIADLLVPLVEPTLSPACRAFRKGTSAQAAAADVGRWIEEGKAWVLRADIRRFFDSISPQVLRAKLEPFVDRDGLELLGRIVRSKVYDQHHLSEMVVGISQGSPLSPLLANLYLAEVDHAMAERFPLYLRYCDDTIVLDADEKQAQEAKDLLGGLLEPLELELHPEKTRVCRAEDGFVFLGFQFGATGRGPAVKAVEALYFRLDELTKDGAIDGEQLDAVCRGWAGYFGDHPECWLSHPAGILGLLRAKGSTESTYERARDARWGLSRPVPPGVALELAAAWVNAGIPDHAWLELATSVAASQADSPLLDRWASLLGVEAERLRQVVRSLVGEPEARLATLTEQLAELGRYGEAQQLAAVGIAPFTGGTAATEAAGGENEVDEVRVLEEAFQGREGVHAVEDVNEAGHRYFRPVYRPITQECWRAHLAGRRTLALAMVRADQTVLWGVLDIDVERRIVDQEPARVDDYLGRALGAALRLRSELERRGCASLLELGACTEAKWVISHPSFRPSSLCPQSRNPRHSAAMPAVSLNRSQQI